MGDTPSKGCSHIKACEDFCDAESQETPETIPPINMMPFEG